MRNIVIILIFIERDNVTIAQIGIAAGFTELVILPSVFKN